MALVNFLRREKLPALLVRYRVRGGPEALEGPVVRVAPGELVEVEPALLPLVARTQG